MQVETEKLMLKIAKTDKRALEQIARAEGEPVSVIVRRIIRNVTRAATQQTVNGAQGAGVKQ